ncbi:MAG: hypothetical protein KatS3mg043_0288 [Rhodothermaceae bacterium]|nr:MAG: hypothetical protein KatS3mg043_0288 [Rhodothermaceae bacterium]
MSLSFGFSPWLLVLCLFGAAGLTYWAYRQTVPALPAGRRVLLGGLRFLALFVVLFLLFEPILRRFEARERPPVLAVLVDDSQSLGLVQEDEAGDPVNLATTVREALRRLPEDALGGTVRSFAFSDDVRPLPETPARFDSLRFEGARTNIAYALDYVREALKGENLRGVLLVSDGLYNTGRNPLYVAERFPVPVHTVVVGDTTARRDVQIRRITTNELAYVGTVLPVQVGVRVRDYPGERVTVSLMKDGAVLQSVPVTLPEGTAEVPVDLTYTPEAEGLHQLQVVVTRLPGELTYRNNAETVTVQVLKSRRRLLLLAGPPNPDLAALRQLLDGDENTEVVSFVQKAAGAFYEGTPPASFSDFDLILLAGYPGPGADTALLDRVAAAAEAGTPFLFLYHPRTDLRALQRHLGDVLPAVPQAVRTGTLEAVPLLTPEGERHPILDVPEVPASLLRRLPPLFCSESRWQASPDARVLARIEVRGVALNDPLLVVRQRGGSRSAALLGAGTWRWKNVPEDLEAVAPFWPAVFENLVQWVATREDDRRVRVRPAEDLFGGGEAVLLNGQVYDESLNPVDDAAVEVEVVTPDSTRLPYRMEAAGHGRYVLDLGSLPEGTYRYTARALREGTELGTDRGTFSVGALTLEYRETQANTALLRQIAERSGGNFFFPGDLGTLPERLSSSGLFTPVVIEETSETRLWQRYPFLILAILLLTAEWFLRKRSGMV